MRLHELRTPCLVLERGILARNLARMAAAAAAHGVGLRAHMKTAKSIDVARLALAAHPGGITVSTLAEAAYFAGHGIGDMLYAVGITPRKLDEVAALNAAGADVAVIIDDPEMAALVAALPVPVRALIEVDSGEHRGGMAAADARLLAVAARLGPRLAGVMTHGGHSYAGRSLADMAAVAEQERAAVTGAAARLRAAGHRVGIVSMGSSPTALHAARLDGVTELRAGVYMFGDLFQAEILTHARADIAVSVLSSVIGLRPGEGRFVIDAGGLALSKDRSTEATAQDCGFGLVMDAAGTRALGTVRSAFQEHGVVAGEPEGLRIGSLVRVLPNHTCMTVAAHERYHVVDGSDEVLATWGRVNGW